MGGHSHEYTGFVRWFRVLFDFRRQTVHDFQKYRPDEIQLIESLEKHRSLIFSVALDGSKEVEFTFLTNVERSAYHMKVYVDSELKRSALDTFPPVVKSVFRQSKPARFDFCRFQKVPSFIVFVYRKIIQPFKAVPPLSSRVQVEARLL